MRKRKKKKNSGASRTKTTARAEAISKDHFSPDHQMTEAVIENLAAPVHELPRECFEDNLLEDEEAWLLFMEPALCENPVAAVSLARLLCTLKQAIDSGPEGAKRASFTLSYGIEMAYEYTEAHQLALRLFNLYLEGRLRVEDEPLQLLNSAIARADPEKN
jgi:hypothetical protein